MSDDAYRDLLVRNERFSRERLRQQAEQVQHQMGSLLAQLDRDDPIVNELGELQTSGTFLDTFCARYSRDRRALKDYDAFVESRS